MTRIGLYGGSFDPFHRGHLDPVLAARRRLELERVIYLPTARPPHKPEGTAAPALARYAMTELALLHQEGCEVSDFEMTERVAYTVDTLEHFRNRWPRAGLVLILGADSLIQLAAWHRWRDLVGLCEIAVLVRPGWELDPAELAPELRTALAAGRIHPVSNPPLAISSSELRRRFAAGEAVGPDVLPPLVLDYVRKYDLYRSSPPDDRLG